MWLGLQGRGAGSALPRPAVVSESLSSRLSWPRGWNQWLKRGSRASSDLLLLKSHLPLPPAPGKTASTEAVVVCVLSQPCDYPRKPPSLRWGCWGCSLFDCRMVKPPASCLNGEQMQARVPPPPALANGSWTVRRSRKGQPVTRGPGNAPRGCV